MVQKLSGSESMESVDHTSDCPVQLFFYELQMAVKALLKQINIPLHQVPVFTIFIFFLWLMETALWGKTQEVKKYMYTYFVHLFTYHFAHTCTFSI